MKFIYLIIVIFLFSHSYETYGGDIVNNDIVNTETMASELAEVYIRNIYGQSVAQKQKPYIAKENLEYWEIQGKPPLALGGSFLIKIAKKDGRVLEVKHFK